MILSTLSAASVWWTGQAHWKWFGSHVFRLQPRGDARDAEIRRCLLLHTQIPCYVDVLLARLLGNELLKVNLKLFSWPTLLVWAT